MNPMKIKFHCPFTATFLWNDLTTETKEHNFTAAVPNKVYNVSSNTIISTMPDNNWTSFQSTRLCHNIQHCFLLTQTIHFFH